MLGPMAIVPGVFMLGGLEPSAVYVVDTGEGLVLVDSGLDRDGGPLKEEMKELGLDWMKIKIILLTHAHGDHTGGVEDLRRGLGAKIYAGKGDAGVLRAGQPREAFFSTFFMPTHRTHQTVVDVELSGGETIALGDATFRAIGAPGHTPGSMCYLLEKGGLRILFGGDVITGLKGDGSNDPMGAQALGTYSAYLAPRYRGDAESYLATLKALRDLPAPDLVLPGHPRSDPSPQSPRFTPERWHALIDRGIGDLEALIDRTKADGADFLDGEPKVLLPDLLYLGDFREMAVYGLFSRGQFVLFDAPGGPGLLDFVKRRLRDLGRDAAAPSVVLLTSCSPEATAGLKDLAKACHPLVVASKAGIEATRKVVGPDASVAPAEDWCKTSPFPVRPIALKGRGLAPIAYELAWAGKTVLVSGQIPILFDHYAVQSLSNDLSVSRENVAEYLLSLSVLAEKRPDLWLPSVPSDGQNANVYDDGWKSIIEKNFRAANAILVRFP